MPDLTDFKQSELFRVIHCEKYTKIQFKGKLMKNAHKGIAPAIITGEYEDLRLEMSVDQFLSDIGDKECEVTLEFKQ